MWFYCSDVQNKCSFSIFFFNRKHNTFFSSLPSRQNNWNSLFNVLLYSLITCDSIIPSLSIFRDKKIASREGYESLPYICQLRAMAELCGWKLWHLKSCAERWKYCKVREVGTDCIRRCQQALLWHKHKWTLSHLQYRHLDIWRLIFIWYFNAVCLQWSHFAYTAIECIHCIFFLSGFHLFATSTST